MALTNEQERWPVHWEPDRGWKINVHPGWVAAPLITSPDMLVNDPSRLLRTAVASADSALVIGEAENMSVSSESIGLDEQALRSALEQLVTTDVGVTTPQLRWAVLSSEAEFGLAIGETRFVESLLGGSLSDAADQFRSYVAEWQDPPRYLLSLADLD